LVGLTIRQPKMFQVAFITFIDRLLTLDAEDIYLRLFLRLLEKLYHEFLSPKLETLGPHLLKSIIKHLVDLFNLQKLIGKLQ
jgi:hypothetical protein